MIINYLKTVQYYIVISRVRWETGKEPIRMLFEKKTVWFEIINRENSIYLKIPPLKLGI